VIGCQQETFVSQVLPKSVRPSESVAQFLLEEKPANRIALLLREGQYNYGELHAASSDVARFLLQAGGCKGDRVIVVGENSFFWVSAYLGILHAGMVCVPLPSNLSVIDLRRILQLTEPRFAFLQTKFAAKNGAHFDSVSVITDREVSSLPGSSESLSFVSLRAQVKRTQVTFPPVCAEDLAALMFTSGSTGKPHGVMISHGNIIANTESIIQCIGLTETDRIMTVLPFHYCFGTSLLHTHLRVGGSLVIDPYFMYPEKIVQRMRETRCTGFAGVPSHYQILLRTSDLAKTGFPQLRYVQQAGGHLGPTFLRELRQALPETQIFVMYGQTEATARLSCLPPELLDAKIGSIGKGIPGVNLRVLNESGCDVMPGEVGEIVAEGKNIASGYWKEQQQSVASFRSGRLYTGDLATVDDDGFLYIVGRANDFIKCAGRRVSCRQLEEQLLEFEGLLEAAVVGMQDDVLGEAVKAFVVPRNDSSCSLEERLHQYCKKRFPPQLNPKKVVVLNSLPKNTAGKVLKSSLKHL
jgi:acyl-CoA synthetase (AMP-forming)/AMP-acid ligase II